MNTQCITCGIDITPYGVRKYCSSCKKNARRRSCAMWRQRNPEKVAAMKAKYYQNHREECDRKNKEWRMNNPDKYRASARRAATRYCNTGLGRMAKLMYRLTEKYKETSRRYNMSEHGRASKKKYRQTSAGIENDRKHTIARRARMCGAYVYDITVEMMREMAADQRWVCGFPGCNDIKLTLDHVTPLSKGGTHTLDNLWYICRHHNSSKGDKIGPDWDHRLSAFKQKWGDVHSEQLALRLF